MTDKERDKIIKEFNSPDFNRNSFLSVDYSLRYVVNRLRRGIDARVLADCCALTLETLEYKLFLLGFDIHGESLDKQNKIDINKKTSLTPDIEKEIRSLMKKHVDIPDIIEDLNLDKTPQLYKLVANIRKELKEESESLYKTSKLEKENSPFVTMFKL